MEDHVKTPGSDHRKLFFIDSMGALVSAVMLGFVLTKLEHIFGMPIRVLNILSFIAALFAIYSFLCFLTRPVRWRRYLQIIAVANLCYAAATLTLCFIFREPLAMPGILYFAAEITIIALLARAEINAARRPPAAPQRRR